MLKRIPKKTKLLGYTINIEEVSQQAMDDMCREPGNAGLWNGTTKDDHFKIYLAKGVP